MFDNLVISVVVSDLICAVSVHAFDYTAEPLRALALVESLNLVAFLKLVTLGSSLDRLLVGFKRANQFCSHSDLR